LARVRSVLLVDFDNILGATHNNLSVGPGDVPESPEFVAKIANWVGWLEDGALSVRGRRRQFLKKRVYWNAQFDRYRSAFEASGFEAFNCRALAKRKINSGKSSADIVITMDAVELALSLKDLEEIVLLTTDSDFVPVVNRIQSPKLRIVTCGKETDPTYSLYSQHADDVIHMAALREAFSYERQRRKWYRLRSPAPIVTPPEIARERASPLIGRIRAALNETASVGEEVHAPELVRAAGIICQMGERMPDQPLSRSKIVKALLAMEEFTPVFDGGRKAWLGCRSYARMIRRLSDVRPEIEVRTLSGRRIEVTYRDLAEQPRPIRARPFPDAREAQTSEAEPASA
jgi:uncharacterized LabA/DUF88 family protein